MKRIIALGALLAIIVSLCGCGTTDDTTSRTKRKDSKSETEWTDSKGESPKKDDRKYTIGISQLLEHSALDAATQGFKDAVVEELGENVVFYEFVGDGTEEECVRMANSLVTYDVDLIMANAGIAFTAANNATETIPVLGTSVTNYAAAIGVESFNGTIGGNASGTCDMLPPEQTAQMMLQWFPELKEVGLLYCYTDNANVHYQVAEVKKELEAKGVTCRLFTYADASDVSAVASEAAEWAEVIFAPTAIMEYDCMGTIGSICANAGVPVFTDGQYVSESFAVAWLTIDYYDLGYETGKMAVEILRDGADISTMPIRYCPKVTCWYDEKVCQQLGLIPPENFQKFS